MITLEPIGYVHNACPESQAPEFIRKEISEIEIRPEYAAGLHGIGQCEYLDVVFSFHQEKRTELLTRIRTGETRGVFASRSPKRPNHLGITTVQLLEQKGNKLYVKGADALDGSPVVDIKYCDTSAFDAREIQRSIRADSPRIDIIRQIMSGDTRSLLLEAAQLHGHICPGLALGVLGAAQVMQQLYIQGEDPQDYILTAEMQNCPADGALFVTGCTPGTRRFTLGNPEHMCFYLRKANGKGWKVTLKESGRDYLQRHLPSQLTPTERGFATLTLPWEELLVIEETEA